MSKEIVKNNVFLQHASVQDILCLSVVIKPGYKSPGVITIVVARGYATLRTTASIVVAIYLDVSYVTW